MCFLFVVVELFFLSIYWKCYKTITWWWNEKKKNLWMKSSRLTMVMYQIEKSAECWWSDLKGEKRRKNGHRERRQRLNSNLTKWLNAKVAPIFALRLRITAFLTFFYLFSFIYLSCHVFLNICLYILVAVVRCQQQTERKISTFYYIENNITLHLGEYVS